MIKAAQIICVGALFSLVAFFGFRADSAPNAILVAKPSAGAAPLSVTFTLAGRANEFSSYSVDFGDGGKRANPSSEIGAMFPLSHVYEKSGTYRVMLEGLDPRHCPHDAPCAPSQPIATATITVSASAAATIR